MFFNTHQLYTHAFHTLQLGYFCIFFSLVITLFLAWCPRMGHTQYYIFYLSAVELARRVCKVLHSIDIYVLASERAWR